MDSILGVKVDTVLRNHRFGCNVVRIDNPDNYVTLARHPDLGVDYRARMYPTDDKRSVFDGLSFDPDRLTSQMVALVDKDLYPVGCSTLILAPRRYIEQQCYLKRDGITGSVVVQSFQDVNGIEEIPDYLLTLGWTTVLPDYRTRFALAGFRYLKEVISIIKKNAPSPTWIEVVANGIIPTESILGLGDELRSGNTILNTTINPLQVGICDPEAMSTVKFCDVIGIRQLPGVGNLCLGADFSGGPVFACDLSKL